MTSQTVRDLLKAGQQFLENESSYLESQLLLGKVLSKPRSWLIAHDEEVVDDLDRATYLQSIEKLCDGYPIAYLLGEQEFWNLNLKVNENTLIPRPETECLVEEVIARHPPRPCTVLDLGTGTGAIALAIASEFKQDQVIAMDISSSAIETAEINRQNNRLDNVHLFIGSWASGIATESIDILVSNPPYIAEQDHHLANLRHEPASALVSGHDGLNDIHAIGLDARRLMKPGGLVFIEHGYDQQQEVIEILTANGLVKIKGKQDLAGQPRYVVAVAP